MFNCPLIFDARPAVHKNKGGLWLRRTYGNALLAERVGAVRLKRSVELLLRRALEALLSAHGELQLRILLIAEEDQNGRAGSGG